MTPTTATRHLDRLVEAAGEDLKIADHAYQLAMANGDPTKISHALQFWRACMKDYDELKRKQFRRKRSAAY